MKKTQKINDICKEVLTILAFLNGELIEKIPTKVFQKLTELAAESKCSYYISTKKNLNEQNISEESKDLIALLYYNYMADENEKNELLKIWNENEKEYQKKLNEKYNIDNIFKKTNKQDYVNIEKIADNDETSLIQYKETFFTKLKNYVFTILHIKN